MDITGNLWRMAKSGLRKRSEAWAVFIDRERFPGKVKIHVPRRSQSVSYRWTMTLGRRRPAEVNLERAGVAVEVGGDGDTGLALATGVDDVLMVDQQTAGKGGLEVSRTLATWRALPPHGHGNGGMAMKLSPWRR